MRANENAGVFKAMLYYNIVTNLIIPLVLEAYL